MQLPYCDKELIQQILRTRYDQATNLTVTPMAPIIEVSLGIKANTVQLFRLVPEGRSFSKSYQ
jgi:hypothetical protein